MCTCERVREDFGVKLHSPLYRGVAEGRGVILHSPLYRGVAEGRGVTVIMIPPRWGYCDVAPSEAECTPSEAEGWGYYDVAPMGLLCLHPERSRGHYERSRGGH